jgi:hypothetical protein
MFSAHKLDYSESAQSPCKEMEIEAMGKSGVLFLLLPHANGHIERV